MSEVERLTDALDHIMRVCRQANTPTKRLKMLELRAKSALEGTDEWRDYDYPRNRERARENLRKRFKISKELLARATCPDEDCVDGAIPHQVGDDDWEAEQCQWCAEREALFALSQ